MKCLYNPNWTCWSKNKKPETEECVCCLVSVLNTQLQYQYQLLQKIAQRFHFDLSQIEKTIQIEKKQIQNINQLPQVIYDDLLYPVLFMTDLLLLICQKFGVKIK